MSSDQSTDPEKAKPTIGDWDQPPRWALVLFGIEAVILVLSVVVVAHVESIPSWVGVVGLFVGLALIGEAVLPEGAGEHTAWRVLGRWLQPRLARHPIGLSVVGALLAATALLLGPFSVHTIHMRCGKPLTVAWQTRLGLDEQRRCSDAVDVSLWRPIGGVASALGEVRCIKSGRSLKATHKEGSLIISCGIGSAGDIKLGPVPRCEQPSDAFQVFKITDRKDYGRVTQFLDSLAPRPGKVLAGPPLVTLRILNKSDGAATTEQAIPIDDAIQHIRMRRRADDVPASVMICPAQVTKVQSPAKYSFSATPQAFKATYGAYWHVRRVAPPDTASSQAFAVAIRPEKRTLNGWRLDIPYSERGLLLGWAVGPADTTFPSALGGPGGKRWRHKTADHGTFLEVGSPAQIGDGHDLYLLFSRRPSALWLGAPDELLHPLGPTLKVKGSQPQ